MCLTISRNRKPLVEKAEQAIQCWKVLAPRGRGFSSPHFNARYRRGELKAVKQFSSWRFMGADVTFTSIFPDDSRRVDAGLHSHGRLSRAKARSLGNYIAVECRIPKGTLFIRGTFGELVSLKLKVGKAIAGLDSNVKKFNRVAKKK